MFKVIEELMNRFIEFILQYVQGTTAEERLTSALRTCIYTTTALFWLVISLLVSSVLMKVEIANLQAGIQRINVLFDSSATNSPFSEFVKLNNSLVQRLELSVKEKESLLRENSKLATVNEGLTTELKLYETSNNDLRVELGICKREDRLESTTNHNPHSRSYAK